MMDWRSPRNKKWIRTVALTLVIAFLNQDIVWAEGGSPVWLEHKPDGFPHKRNAVETHGISIPKDIAVIKESSTSDNGNCLIMNIQDAHASFAAQESISKVLETLVTNYDLKLVAMEGSSGYIDTSLLRTFPHEAIRKETARSLMKRGKLSASEFFAITSNKEIALYGIDDRELYTQNVEQFTRLYEINETLAGDLELIARDLRDLENAIYPSEAKEFERNSSLIADTKLSFSERWDSLKGAAVKFGIDYASYANLAKLVQAIELEKGINFDKANRERDGLIDALSKTLQKEELEALVLKSLAFKMQKITPGEFYTYLQEKAQGHGLSSAPYANLIAYTGYMTLYESIDLIEVFEELRRFEGSIKERIFKTQDQKSLYRLSKAIGLIRDLVGVKLTTSDVSRLEAVLAETTAGDAARTMRELSLKYEVPLEGGWDLGRIFAAIPEGLEFYRTAEKRNEDMLKNTIARMSDEGQRVAALVTGGFHSKGLADLLQENKASYLVILPKFDKDSDRPYVAVLTNKKEPYEKLLESGQYFLATSSYFANGYFDFKTVMAYMQEVIFVALGQAVLRGEDVEATKERWLGAYAQSQEMLGRKGRIKGSEIITRDRLRAILENFECEKISPTAAVIKTKDQAGQEHYIKVVAEGDTVGLKETTDREIEKFEATRGLLKSGQAEKVSPTLERLREAQLIEAVRARAKELGGRPEDMERAFRILRVPQDRRDALRSEVMKRLVADERAAVIRRIVSRVVDEGTVEIQEGETTKTITVRELIGCIKGYTECLEEYPQEAGDHIVYLCARLADKFKALNAEAVAGFKQFSGETVKETFLPQEDLEHVIGMLTTVLWDKIGNSLAAVLGLARTVQLRVGSAEIIERCRSAVTELEMRFGGLAGLEVYDEYVQSANFTGLKFDYKPLVRPIETIMPNLPLAAREETGRQSTSGLARAARPAQEELAKQRDQETIEPVQEKAASEYSTKKVYLKYLVPIIIAVASIGGARFAHIPLLAVIGGAIACAGLVRAMAAQGVLHISAIDFPTEAERTQDISITDIERLSSLLGPQEAFFLVVERQYAEWLARVQAKRRQPSLKSRVSQVLYLVENAFESFARQGAFAGFPFGIPNFTALQMRVEEIAGATSKKERKRIADKLSQWMRDLIHGTGSERFLGYLNGLLGSPSNSVITRALIEIALRDEVVSDALRGELAEIMKDFHGALVEFILALIESEWLSWESRRMASRGHHGKKRDIDAREGELQKTIESRRDEIEALKREIISAVVRTMEPAHPKSQSALSSLLESVSGAVMRPEFCRALVLAFFLGIQGLASQGGAFAQGAPAAPPASAPAQVIPLSELTSGRETPGLTGQKIEELVNERQSAYEMLKTGSTVELPDGRKVRLETGGVRRTNANYQRLVSGEGPAPGPHTVVTDRNGTPITELAPAGESTLITNDTGVPLAEVWKDGGTGRTIVYMREGGKRVSARVVAQMPNGSTKIVDVSRLLNVRFTILPGTTVDATGSVLFFDFSKDVDRFVSAFLDVAGYTELEGLLNARVPGYSSMSVEQKLNHATRWAYFFAEQKVWLFLTDEETRLLVKMVQESPDINPDTKEVSWDSIRTICNAEAGKRDVRGWVTGKLTEYERLISVGQIEEAQTLLRVVNMALDEYRLGLERKDGNGYEWAVRDYEWVLNEMEDMYSRAGRLSDFRTAWGISVSEDLSSATWQADDGKAYTAEQNGEVNTPFHLKGVGTVRRAGTTYEAGITFDTPQDLFNKVFVFDVKLLGESYEGRRLQAMAEDEHGIVNDVSDRVDLYRSENKFIQWTSARIRFETPRVGGFNPRAVKRLYFVLDGNKLEDSDGVLTIRNPRIQSRPRLDGDAYVALYGQRESVIDIAAFEKSVQSRLQSLKIDLFLDFVKRALFLILGFIGVLKILDMLRSRRRGPASTTSAGTGTPSSTPPSSPTGGPATSGRTSTSGIDYGQVDSELGTIRDGLIRVFDDAHMRLEPDMYIGRTREKPRLFQINSLPTRGWLGLFLGVLPGAFLIAVNTIKAFSLSMAGPWYFGWGLDVWVIGIGLFVAGAIANSDFIKARFHFRKYGSAPYKTTQREVIDGLLDGLVQLRHDIEALEGQYGLDGESLKELLTFPVQAPFADPNQRVRIHTQQINLVEYLDYCIEWLTFLRDHNEGYELLSRAHYPFYNALPGLIPTFWVKGPEFTQLAQAFSMTGFVGLLPGTGADHPAWAVPRFGTPFEAPYNGNASYTNGFTTTVPISNLPMYMETLRDRLRKIQEIELNKGRPFDEAQRLENNVREKTVSDTVWGHKGRGGPGPENSSYLRVKGRHRFNFWSFAAFFYPLAVFGSLASRILLTRFALVHDKAVSLHAVVPDLSTVHLIAIGLAAALILWALDSLFSRRVKMGYWSVRPARAFNFLIFHLPIAAIVTALINFLSSTHAFHLLIPQVAELNLGMHAIIVPLAAITGYMTINMLMKMQLFTWSFKGGTETVRDDDIMRFVPEDILSEVVGDLGGNSRDPVRTIRRWSAEARGLGKIVRLLWRKEKPSEWPIWRMRLERERPNPGSLDPRERFGLLPRYPLYEIIYLVTMEDRAGLLSALQEVFTDGRFAGASTACPAGAFNNKDLIAKLTLDDIRTFIRLKGDEILHKFAVMDTSFGTGAGDKLKRMSETAFASWAGPIDIFIVLDDNDRGGYADIQNVLNDASPDNIPCFFRDRIHILTFSEHGANLGRTQRKVRMKPPINSEAIQQAKHYYAKNGERLPDSLELVDEEDRLGFLNLRSKACVWQMRGCAIRDQLDARDSRRRRPDLGDAERWGINPKEIRALEREFDQVVDGLARAAGLNRAATHVLLSVDEHTAGAWLSLDAASRIKYQLWAFLHTYQATVGGSVAGNLPGVKKNFVRSEFRERNLPYVIQSELRLIPMKNTQWSWLAYMDYLIWHSTIQTGQTQSGFLFLGGTGNNFRWSLLAGTAYVVNADGTISQDEVELCDRVRLQNLLMPLREILQEEEETNGSSPAVREPQRIFREYLTVYSPPGVWDLYNIIEDSELGRRTALYKLKNTRLEGKYTQILEELLPTTGKAWWYQRSRWIIPQTFSVILSYRPAAFMFIGQYLSMGFGWALVGSRGNVPLGIIVSFACFFIGGYLFYWIGRAINRVGTQSGSIRNEQWQVDPLKTMGWFKFQNIAHLSSATLAAVFTGICYLITVTYLGVMLGAGSPSLEHLGGIGLLFHSMCGQLSGLVPIFEGWLATFMVGTIVFVSPPIIQTMMGWITVLLRAFEDEESTSEAVKMRLGLGKKEYTLLVGIDATAERLGIDTLTFNYSDENEVEELLSAYEEDLREAIDELESAAPIAGTFGLTAIRELNEFRKKDDSRLTDLDPLVAGDRQEIIRLLREIVLQEVNSIRRDTRGEVDIGWKAGLFGAIVVGIAALLWFKGVSPFWVVELIGAVGLIYLGLFIAEVFSRLVLRAPLFSVGRLPYHGLKYFLAIPRMIDYFNHLIPAAILSIYMITHPWAIDACWLRGRPSIVARFPQPFQKMFKDWIPNRGFITVFFIVLPYLAIIAIPLIILAEQYGINLSRLFSIETITNAITYFFTKAPHPTGVSQAMILPAVGAMVAMGARGRRKAGDLGQGGGEATPEEEPESIESSSRTSTSGISRRNLVIGFAGGAVLVGLGAVERLLSWKPPAQPTERPAQPPVRPREQFGVSGYVNPATYGCDVGMADIMPGKNFVQHVGFSSNKDLPKLFQTWHEHGVQIVRIFTFADLRWNSGVEFDSEGNPLKLDEYAIADLRALLATAAQSGIRVIPVLFDFTVADGKIFENGIPVGEHPDLFRDASKRQALVRLFEEIPPDIWNHEAVAAWEILNEPEGVSAASQEDVRKFVRDFAELVVRRSDKPVTVGCKEPENVVQWRGLDDSLRSLDPQGRGRFWYQAHAYVPRQQLLSRAELERFGLPKDAVLIVGEFGIEGISQSQRTALYERTTKEALEMGYDTVLWWAYPNEPDLAPPIEKAKEMLEGLPAQRTSTLRSDSGSSPEQEGRRASTSGEVRGVRHSYIEIRPDVQPGFLQDLVERRYREIEEATRPDGRPVFTEGYIKSDRQVREERVQLGEIPELGIREGVELVIHSAPWREAYKRKVLAPAVPFTQHGSLDGKTVTRSCIFCELPEEEVLFRVRINDNAYIVAVNINPFGDYHVMLISEEPLPQIPRGGVEDVLLFMRALGPEYKGFFNLTGAAATVPHFHVQIMKGKSPLLRNVEQGKVEVVPEGEFEGIEIGSLKGWVSEGRVYASSDAKTVAQAANRDFDRLFAARTMYDTYFGYNEQGEYELILIPRETPRPASIEELDTTGTFVLGANDNMGDVVAPHSSALEAIRAHPERLAQALHDSCRAGALPSLRASSSGTSVKDGDLPAQRHDRQSPSGTPSHGETHERQSSRGSHMEDGASRAKEHDRQSTSGEGLGYTETTNPGEHNEDFIYLAHAITSPHEFPEDWSLELAKIRQRYPRSWSEPLSCSLVDKDHPQVFSFAGFFVSIPSDSDVVVAHYRDLQTPRDRQGTVSDNITREEYVNLLTWTIQGFNKKNPVAPATEILKNTTDAHNEVLLRGSRTTIQGVFIRPDLISLRGGERIVEEIVRFAVEKGLPIVVFDYRGPDNGQQAREMKRVEDAISKAARDQSRGTLYYIEPSYLILNPQRHAGELHTVVKRVIGPDGTERPSVGRASTLRSDSPSTGSGFVLSERSVSKDSGSSPEKGRRASTSGEVKRGPVSYTGTPTHDDSRGRKPLVKSHETTIKERIGKAILISPVFITGAVLIMAVLLGVQMVVHELGHATAHYFVSGVWPQMELDIFHLRGAVVSSLDQEPLNAIGSLIGRDISEVVMNVAGTIFEFIFAVVPAFVIALIAYRATRAKSTALEWIDSTKRTLAELGVIAALTGYANTVNAIALATVGSDWEKIFYNFHLSPLPYVFSYLLASASVLVLSGKAVASRLPVRETVSGAPTASITSGPSRFSSGEGLLIPVRDMRQVPSEQATKSETREARASTSGMAFAKLMRDTARLGRVDGVIADFDGVDRDHEALVREELIEATRGLSDRDVTKITVTGEETGKFAEKYGGFERMGLQNGATRYAALRSSGAVGHFVTSRGELEEIPGYRPAVLGTQRGVGILEAVARDALRQACRDAGIAEIAEHIEIKSGTTGVTIYVEQDERVRAIRFQIARLIREQLAALKAEEAKRPEGERAVSDTVDVVASAGGVDIIATSKGAAAIQMIRLLRLRHVVLIADQVGTEENPGNDRSLLALTQEDLRRAGIDWDVELTKIYVGREENAEMPEGVVIAPRGERESDAALGIYHAVIKAKDEIGRTSTAGGPSAQEPIREEEIAAELVARVMSLIEGKPGMWQNLYKVLQSWQAKSSEGNRGMDLPAEKVIEAILRREPDREGDHAEALSTLEQLKGVLQTLVARERDRVGYQESGLVTGEEPSRREEEFEPEAVHRLLSERLQEILPPKLIEAHPRIMEAFQRRPRHEFLPSGMKSRAYLDAPLPLLIEGQTTSQPSLIFRMLSYLNPQEGERVLEIGAGGGYAVTLLSHIVGAQGEAVGLEVRPALAQFAEQNLRRLGIENAGIIARDAAEYLAESGESFHAILVSCEVEEAIVRARILPHLEEGGRLIAPIKLPTKFGGMSSRLRLYEKGSSGEISSRDLPDYTRFVSFVDKTSSASPGQDRTSTSGGEKEREREEIAQPKIRGDIAKQALRRLMRLLQDRDSESSPEMIELLQAEQFEEFAHRFEEQDRELKPEERDILFKKGIANPGVAQIVILDGQRSLKELVERFFAARSRERRDEIGFDIAQLLLPVEANFYFPVLGELQHKLFLLLEERTVRKGHVPSRAELDQVGAFVFAPLELDAFEKLSLRMSPKEYAIGVFRSAAGEIRTLVVQQEEERSKKGLTSIAWQFGHTHQVYKSGSILKTISVPDTASAVSFFETSEGTHRAFVFAWSVEPNNVRVFRLAIYEGTVDPDKRKAQAEDYDYINEGWVEYTDRDAFLKLEELGILKNGEVARQWPKPNQKMESELRASTSGGESIPSQQIDTPEDTSKRTVPIIDRWSALEPNEKIDLMTGFWDVMDADVLADILPWFMRLAEDAGEDLAVRAYARYMHASLTRKVSQATSTAAEKDEASEDASGVCQPRQSTSGSGQGTPSEAAESFAEEVITRLNYPFYSAESDEKAEELEDRLRAILVGLERGQRNWYWNNLTPEAKPIVARRIALAIDTAEDLLKLFNPREENAIQAILAYGSFLWGEEGTPPSDADLMVVHRGRREDGWLGEYGLYVLDGIRYAHFSKERLPLEIHPTYTRDFKFRKAMRGQIDPFWMVILGSTVTVSGTVDMRAAPVTVDEYFWVAADLLDKAEEYLDDLSRGGRRGDHETSMIERKAMRRLIEANFVLAEIARQHGVDLSAAEETEVIQQIVDIFNDHLSGRMQSTLHEIELTFGSLREAYGAADKAFNKLRMDIPGEEYAEFESYRASTAGEPRTSTSGMSSALLEVIPVGKGIDSATQAVENLLRTAFAFSAPCVLIQSPIDILNRMFTGFFEGASARVNEVASALSPYVIGAGVVAAVAVVVVALVRHIRMARLSPGEQEVPESAVPREEAAPAEGGESASRSSTSGARGTAAHPPEKILIGIPAEGKSQSELESARALIEELTNGKARVEPVYGKTAQENIEIVTALARDRRVRFGRLLDTQNLDQEAIAVALESIVQDLKLDRRELRSIQRFLRLPQIEKVDIDKLLRVLRERTLRHDPSLRYAYSQNAEGFFKAQTQAASITTQGVAEAGLSWAARIEARWKRMGITDKRDDPIKEYLVITDRKFDRKGVDRYLIARGLDRYIDSRNVLFEETSTSEVVARVQRDNPGLGLDRIGIRTLEQEENFTIDRDDVVTLKLGKVTTTSGQELYVNINMYEVLFELLAASEKPQVPGLENEKGTQKIYLYLPPIVPHDYEKEMTRYRLTVERIMTAA